MGVFKIAYEGNLTLRYSKFFNGELKIKVYNKMPIMAKIKH